MNGKGLKKSLISYLLMAPALLSFVVFMFYPLVKTVYLSFFDWNMIKLVKKFVGLENYKLIFSKPAYGKVMINTGIYILILVLFNFLVAYLIAYILEVVLKKWKTGYIRLLFLPSLMSLVVASLLFLWLLNPLSGPVASVLGFFGVKAPIWSKTEVLVILVIGVITSWKVFGYNLILLLAGISGISKEVLEAAKMDGIGSFHLFTDFVLPMSSATGIYVLVTTIVQGLQHAFTPIKTITLGGPNYASSNLIYQSYEEAFRLYKTGISSAFSVLTILIFAVLMFLEFKYVERRIFYEN